jgi:pimeloyl-ACP methyl ester carboxylesterase
VRRLVLAEPGLRLDGDAGPELDRDGFRQRALALLRQDQADAALELFIDTVSGAGTWARMVPWLRRMMRDNANTLIGQAAEHYESVNRDSAGALRMPVLLVGGALSPPPYPALLDGLAALLPGARRSSIPAASHAMNLWNAAAFNREVQSFLAD